MVNNYYMQLGGVKLPVFYYKFVTNAKTLGVKYSVNHVTGLCRMLDEEDNDITSLVYVGIGEN